MILVPTVTLFLLESLAIGDISGFTSCFKFMAYISVSIKSFHLSYECNSTSLDGHALY